jgi:hypothetical protein
MEVEFSSDNLNSNGYLDSAMQPDYVDASVVRPNKIHAMILRLASNKKGAIPSEMNPAVMQMRMVLVAGVISASFRLEKNDSAEDSNDLINSNIAKIFLSVKMSPTSDDSDGFVVDLNKAILDASEGSFKLGNVDFWENHVLKSGKDTPADTVEKSTEFAESENDNDDGMYLDDDEKLASRVANVKGSNGGNKKSSSRRPWSMFNPSSALGLNSVFNSSDLLEMVEYDSDEAEARKQEMTTKPVAPTSSSSRFGFFSRLFG